MNSSTHSTPFGSTSRTWLCAAALMLSAHASTSLAQTIQPFGPAPAPTVNQITLAPAPVNQLASSADRFTQWVLQSKDNQNLPFVVIDKPNAQVSVFDQWGRLLGKQPVLLGMQKGDVDPPGIGQRSLKSIGPSQRITPAGRFVGSLGKSLENTSILWVDYKSALALHPIVKGTVKDNRAGRLASPTSSDNRISYGCINVPTAFYNSVITTTFAGTKGVVYILPESADPIAFFSRNTPNLANQIPTQIQNQPIQAITSSPSQAQ